MCQSLDTPEDIPGGYLCARCIEQELDSEDPLTQLHRAVQSGDVRLISKILTAAARRGEAVALACTSHDTTRHTALQAAIEARQLKSLKAICTALGGTAAASASTGAVVVIVRR